MPPESLARGAQRRVGAELEQAIECLRRAGEQPASEQLEVEAIHDVRRHFKKARAGLRLLRQALGVEAYRLENRRLRDAGRSLAAARDARVLLETLNKIAPNQQRLRDALRANAQQLHRRSRYEPNAFAVMQQLAAAALARLQARDVESCAGATIEHGVGRVYRVGRRAFSRARAEPTTENLHELRKRTQYLRGALELLELNGKPTRRASQLSRLLGDDHDLAVLHQRLVATHAGSPAVEDTLRIIDRARRKLQKRALVVGRRLYRAPAKRFLRDLELGQGPELGEGPPPTVGGSLTGAWRALCLLR